MEKTFRVPKTFKRLSTQNIFARFRKHNSQTITLKDTSNPDFECSRIKGSTCNDVDKNMALLKKDSYRMSERIMPKKSFYG